jgi:hypothetical protein
MKTALIANWGLDSIDIGKDKPADYVSCELTPFVAREVFDIEFFRISPKKTVCLLTFQNGFDVVGTSGCINPAHYRADIGSKYALRDAVDKAGPILAYAEQTKLQKSPGTETYCKPE